MEGKSPYQRTMHPCFPQTNVNVQEIVGTLLYCSQAVDPTLACALSSIAAKQANGTKSVLDACYQLLDYVATHPHAATFTMPAK